MTDADQADLAEVWTYVAVKASDATATRLLDKIEAACVLLCEFPQIGPARQHLALGPRVTFEGNYAVHFLHDEHELLISRAAWGARCPCLGWTRRFHITS